MIVNEASKLKPGMLLLTKDSDGYQHRVELVLQVKGSRYTCLYRNNGGDITNDDYRSAGDNLDYNSVIILNNARAKKKAMDYLNLKIEDIKEVA